MISLKVYQQHNDNNDNNNSIEFNDNISIINIPLKHITSSIDHITKLVNNNDNGNVYVICRRGIDSITATNLLKDRYHHTHPYHHHHHHHHHHH